MFDGYDFYPLQYTMYVNHLYILLRRSSGEINIRFVRLYFIGYSITIGRILFAMGLISLLFTILQLYRIISRILAP